MEYCWDLETTGRTATDQITVIGALATDTGTYHAHYLAPPEMDLEDVRDVEDFLLDNLPNEAFEGENGITDIITHGYRKEEYLIEGFQLQVVGPDGENAIGETFIGHYSNRYDLPLLRTRSMKNDIGWKLNGGTSRDLWDTFKYKFSTDIIDVSGLNKPKVKQFAEWIEADIDKSARKAELIDAIEDHGYTANELDEFVYEEGLDRPTTSVGGLDDLHTLLVGDVEYNDPFEDSEQAVEAFKHGYIEEVVLHNIVDLLKTHALNNTAEEYVSKQEIKERAI